jgi:hypothetical protein
MTIQDHVKKCAEELSAMGDSVIILVTHVEGEITCCASSSRGNMYAIIGSMEKYIRENTRLNPE